MKRLLVLAAAVLMSASAFADAAPNSDIVPPGPTGVPHTCLQNYPSLALKRGEQGSTIVGIAILQDGSVHDPQLQESSGSDLLDQASLDCIKGWTYTPATRNGTPIGVLWTVRIEWFLDYTYEGPVAGEERRPDPRFVPPASPPGEEHECRNSVSYIVASADKITHRPTVIEYTITPSGLTADLKVVRTSGVQVHDDAAIKCIASWHYVPATRDGAAVGVRWTASVPWGVSDTRPPERLSNPEPNSH